MGKSSVRLQILGTSFTIQVDEDPDYLNQLVAYVNTKIENVETTITGKNPLRTAIVTALLITDELFKERKNNANKQALIQDSEEAERLAKQIIEKIDKSLCGN
ncbi:MAG: cell division protein ZapA [Spirochaetota bacterium]